MKINNFHNCSYRCDLGNSKNPKDDYFFNKR
ncbi:MAG: hypothetical protein MRERV_56c009 [Mycoplasmataceae bacterium RV_VA103A]|nr:MAG: hypothetical protein MRERV_56c009 [Mycoplasmataceae bacterium RV_VA103A]